MAYFADGLKRTDSRLVTVDKFPSAISYIDGRNFVYSKNTLLLMAKALKPRLAEGGLRDIIRGDFLNFVAREYVYANRNKEITYKDIRRQLYYYGESADRLIYALRTISDNLDASEFDLNAILAVAVHEFTMVIATEPPSTYSRSLRSDYIWEQLWYLTLKDDFVNIYSQEGTKRYKNKFKDEKAVKRYLEKNFVPLKVKSNNELLSERFVNGSTEPYNIGMVFPNGDEVYFRQLSLSVLLETATHLFQHFISAYVDNQEKIYTEQLPNVDFSSEQGYSLDKKTGKYFIWSKFLNRRVFAEECLEAVEMRELLKLLLEDDSDFVIPDNVVANMHEGYVSKFIMLSMMLMSVYYLNDNEYFLHSILVVRNKESVFGSDYEEGLKNIVLDWMAYLGCRVESDADGSKTFHLY